MIITACEDMNDYTDFISLLLPMSSSESYIKIKEAKSLAYDFREEA